MNFFDNIKEKQVNKLTEQLEKETIALQKGFKLTDDSTFDARYIYKDTSTGEYLYIKITDFGKTKKQLFKNEYLKTSRGELLFLTGAKKGKIFSSKITTKATIDKTSFTGYIFETNINYVNDKKLQKIRANGMYQNDDVLYIWCDFNRTRLDHAFNLKKTSVKLSDVLSKQSLGKKTKVLTTKNNAAIRTPDSVMVK